MRKSNLSLYLSFIVDTMRLTLVIRAKINIFLENVHFDELCGTLSGTTCFLINSWTVLIKKWQLKTHCELSIAFSFLHRTNFLYYTFVTTCRIRGQCSAVDEVVLDGICSRYYIFRNLRVSSFSLPIPRPGEVLGLVGTNGIGKSTALKILAGKQKPNLGRFKVRSAGEVALRNEKYLYFFFLRTLPTGRRFCSIFAAQSYRTTSRRSWRTNWRRLSSRST